MTHMGHLPSATDVLLQLAILSSTPAGLYTLLERRSPAAPTPSEIHRRYPQFRKKHLCLSKSVARDDVLDHDDAYHRHELAIDEAVFVQQHCLDWATLSVAVDVTTSITARRQQSTEVDVMCRAYEFLTSKKQFQLRHGGTFGVHYLAYHSSTLLYTDGDNGGGHSDFLVLLSQGTIPDLERYALVRLARSVGKRAMLLSFEVDGTFSLATLRAGESDA